MSNNYSSFESSPTAYSYSSSTLPSSSSHPRSSSSPPSSTSPPSVESSFDCNICFDVPSDPILSPCGHLFCWSCYHNWYSLGHNDCPSCKAFISIEKIIPIYGKGKNKADHQFVKHHGGAAAGGGSGGINKNSTNSSSTSSSAPPRPHAPRADPPPSSDRVYDNTINEGFGGFFSPFGLGMGGGGGGLTFGAGFGFFPALFGLTFTWNSNDGWQRGGGGGYNQNNHHHTNNNHRNTRPNQNDLGVNENEDANAKMSRALIFFVLIFIFSLLFY